MSKINDLVNGNNSHDESVLAWCMCKIDECTKASCLSYPSIAPYLLDAALQDTSCTSVASVLVLYTGGTIGMRAIDGAYQPVPNYLVKSLLKMPTFNDPHFERSRQRNSVPRASSQSLIQLDNVAQAGLDASATPSNTTFVLPLTKNRRIFYSIAEYTPLLDSSDMTMDDWVRIARDIQSYYDLFDGFVVLHGTDTLAYTASALSFMLENLGKPVVLTGSQVPIFELFRGSRVVKCSSSEFHAFASPNYPVLAKFGTDLIFFPDLVFRPVGPQRTFTIHTELCRDVAVLNMFPSIAAEHVATYLAPPTKGKFHEMIASEKVG
ncbi:unnamed protein product [Echinostoma caproni]|uniref:Asparaginase domain-containing protein n=1 Tax=Echinostoma caproni TaxID=27848 RepID=A0A183B0S9_9TREM|nr:unnamed protein product [Echinostoma caproni]